MNPFWNKLSTASTPLQKRPKFNPYGTKSGISKVNKNVRNKKKRLFDFNSPHGLV